MLSWVEHDVFKTLGLDHHIHLDIRHPSKIFTNKTKSNDLRKIICLRKSKASVERISVCDVMEKLVAMADAVCHTPISMT